MSQSLDHPSSPPNPMKFGLSDDDDDDDTADAKSPPPPTPPLPVEAELQQGRVREENLFWEIANRRLLLDEQLRRNREIRPKLVIQKSHHQRQLQHLKRCEDAVEGMLPNKLSGIKSELADTTGAVSSPPQHPQMRWGCPLCYVPTSSEQFLKHIRGKKHKAMVASFILQKKVAKKALPADGPKEVDEQLSKNLFLKDQQQSFNCYICKLKFWTQSTLSSHLNGKKHKAQLEKSSKVNEENKITNDKAVVAQQYRWAMIEGLGQENSVPVEEFNSHAMIESSRKEDKLVTVEKSGKDESVTVESSRREDKTAALEDPGKDNSQVNTEGCRKEDIPVTVEEPGKDECPTILGFRMKDSPAEIEESGKDNSHVSIDGCRKEEILVVDEEPGKNESPTITESFGIEDSPSVAEESSKNRSHDTIDGCGNEDKSVLVVEPGKNESPNTIQRFGMTDKPSGIEESGKDNSHVTIEGCGKEDKPATVEGTGKEGSPVAAERSGKEDKPTVRESGIDNTPRVRLCSALFQNAPAFTSPPGPSDRRVRFSDTRGQPIRRRGRRCDAGAFWKSAELRIPFTVSSFPGPSIVTGNLPFMPALASVISQSKVTGKPVLEEGSKEVKKPVTVHESGIDNAPITKDKPVLFEEFVKACRPVTVSSFLGPSIVTGHLPFMPVMASFVSQTKVAGKPLPEEGSKEVNNAWINELSEGHPDKLITDDNAKQPACCKPAIYQYSEKGASPVTIEGSGNTCFHKVGKWQDELAMINKFGKSCTSALATKRTYCQQKDPRKKHKSMEASFISQTEVAGKPLTANESKEVAKTLFTSAKVDKLNNIDVGKHITVDEENKLANVKPVTVQQSGKCYNHVALEESLEEEKLVKVQESQKDEYLAIIDGSRMENKLVTNGKSGQANSPITIEGYGKHVTFEKSGQDNSFITVEGSGKQVSLVIAEESSKDESHVTVKVPEKKDNDMTVMEFGRVKTPDRLCTTKGVIGLPPFMPVVASIIPQTKIASKSLPEGGSKEVEISFSSQTKVADKPLPADGSKEVDKRSKEADKPLFTKVPLKLQNQAVTCDVCKLICYTQPTLNSHLNGKKHKARINKLKLAQDDKFITIVEANKPSNSEPAKSHYSEKDTSPVTDQDTGKKCFVRAEYGKDMISVTAEDSVREDKLVMIEESGKACTSAMSAKRRHCEQTDDTDQRKKQKALEASFISPKKVADKPLLEEGLKKGDNPLFTKLPLKQQKQSFDCDICNVKCCSQSVLNSHLNGKKHKARMSKLNKTRDSKLTSAEVNKLANGNPSTSDKSETGTTPISVDVLGKVVFEMGTTPIITEPSGQESKPITFWEFWEGFRSCYRDQAMVVKEVKDQTTAAKEAVQETSELDLFG